MVKPDQPGGGAPAAQTNALSKEAQHVLGR